MKNFIFSFAIALALFGISPSALFAGTLNLLTDKTQFAIGDQFNVDIKIDSEDVGINAAQATLDFPVSVLQAVGIDKANSIVNFWLQDPVIDNANGKISFIGGSSGGVNGKTLQVLRVSFRVVGAGQANLSFSDGAITASDGNGTNVLSLTKGIVLTSIGKQEATLIKPPEIPSVQIIKRPAIPTGKLPNKPDINIPLYPAPDAWYGTLSSFWVHWKLPADVTGIAIELNKKPISEPSTTEGLFDNKTFPPLSDGVWYLHIRFKNDVGFGQTLHYRIAVDTAPPPPFKIEIDNSSSENPSPQITFNVHDALSGISRALLLVDNKEVLQTASTTVALPPVEPGVHTLRVKVFDRGENSVEDNLKFEISPLPTPFVEFISRSVSLEEPFFALGKSIPDGLIEARVLDDSRQEVFKNTTESDSSGNWKVTIDKSLHTGNYTLLVMARDNRGASSYSAKGESFKVRPQTVVSFGGLIELGWFEIFLITLLIIISVASLTAWRYVSKKNTREAYKIIVGRDIEKLSAALLNSLKELEESEGMQDISRRAKTAMIIGRMKETIIKMKKYIGEEVGKLK